MTPIAQPTPATRPGFDPDYLPAFEDKLFIEGPLVKRRLVNFFVLLFLATVIATYGVLAGSTATVIGAMIVAPQMGLIMATSAAVVMGSLPRALRALALVVAGVATVIVCSYILTAVVPEVTISFTGNGEISSRINPDLYALLTALGALLLFLTNFLSCWQAASSWCCWAWARWRSLPSKCGCAGMALPSLPQVS